MVLKEGPQEGHSVSKCFSTGLLRITGVVHSSSKKMFHRKMWQRWKLLAQIQKNMLRGKQTLVVKNFGFIFNSSLIFEPRLPFFILGTLHTYTLFSTLLMLKCWLMSLYSLRLTIATHFLMVTLSNCSTSLSTYRAQQLESLLLLNTLHTSPRSSFSFSG